MRAPTLLLLLLLGTPLLAQPPETPERPPVLVANDAGVAAYEGKRFAEAVGHFRTALRLEPEDQTVRTNLARALHALAREEGAKEGGLIGAVAMLREGENLLPTEAAIPYLLASYLRRLDDLFGARLALQAARERLPRSGLIRLGLGELAYQEERLLEAEEELEAALRLEPKLGERVQALLEKVRREATVERNYFTESRGAFTLKYDDEAFQAVATEILMVLDRAWQDLSTEFRHWPRQRVNVVLYTRERYAEATGAHGWTGGLFDGKIRLPVANYARERQRVQAALRHELTHWFVRDLCPRCPIWLNEGLAQIHEGQRFDAAAKARLKGGEGLQSVTKLPPIWATIPERERVLALYAQALGFTKHLMAQGGRDTAGDLLRALAQGETVSEAVARLLGRPLAELEASFLAELKRP